jgi:hypothetical protein
MFGGKSVWVPGSRVSHVYRGHSFFTIGEHRACSTFIFM